MASAWSRPSARGVTRWEVGDRLIPCFAPDFLGGAPSRARLKRTLGGPLDGMLTEHVIVAEQSAVRAPDHLSDEEAACLPCAALTAWSALATFYSLRPGQVVLTQGTGGVSLFALQLALAHGAEVIVTSSSDEKLERVVEMGATSTINYRTEPDWGQTARAMTPERLGVDHVIEVGGANTLARSLEAVRFGGHISLIGVLSGVVSELNLIPILMQNVRIQGVIVGHRDGFEQMNRALAAHAIRPVISHRFGFDELPEAFAVMKRGDHFGKITLTF